MPRVFGDGAYDSPGSFVGIEVGRMGDDGFASAIAGSELEVIATDTGVAIDSIVVE